MISLLFALMAQVDTATVPAGWVSPTRAPQAPGLELPWLLLRIPQHLLELSFVPLMPVATVFERYHLIPRTLDLLTNEEKTVGVFPVIDPFNASGVGVGASLIYNDPLGSADRLVLFGLLRENRDRQVSLSFGRRIPELSGRVLSLSAGYQADHDTRFFGVGGRQAREDQRLLRRDHVDASLGFTLLGAEVLPEYQVELRAAYRRRRLASGSGDRAPSLVPGDILALPPGFDQTLDYPELTLRFSYDSRDSLGRTSRGLMGDLETVATHDINGGGTGGLTFTSRFAAFIPVLPLHRVLFLSAGLSAALPFAEELPLHQLVRLGGSRTLRGYVSDRFLDRLGWWATAEYRYEFFQYADSGIGLSAALFADAGKVGRNPENLVDGPIPWSVGLGLRLEQTLILIGRAQVAYSPEGFRFSVGFGELL